jgi:lipoate-protein ligase A
MTAALRVIDSGLNTARWNVAMTAALAELRRGGRIADTLRFHRYPKSVLIGRHQVLADAVHVDRCRAAKVEMARRFTGGGAVYMAPGALAWDVVMARKALGSARGSALDHCAAAMGEAVASGLSRLGLSARYRPQNEIEVGGRKICGSSGYFDGETLVCQGTILADTGIGDMARFLRLPARGTGRPLRELARRVATVSELLGRRADLNEIEDVVAAGIARAFGRVLQRDEPTPEELRVATGYLDELGSDSYVEGIDSVRAGALAVGCGGPVNAFVRLHPGAERRIDQVWLTGDFLVSPARAILDLEAALRGLPLHSAPAAAMTLLSDGRIAMQGASRFDIAAAIAGAARTDSKPRQRASRP